MAADIRLPVLEHIMTIRFEAWYAPAIPRLKWSEKRHMYIKEKEEHHEEKSEASSEDEEEEEEEVGGMWMFLFIDLVLVALTSKCAQALEFCALSTHSLLFASTVFTVMFLTRQYLDEYCNRFYANDIAHRLCYFCYVGAFFVMALNVNSVDNEDHLDYKCKSNLYGSGFGVGYITTRLITGLLYGLVMFDEPKYAYEQFCGVLVCRILTVTVVIIMMVCETAANSNQYKGAFPPAFRMYIYLIASFIEFGFDLFHNIILALKKKGIQVPRLLVGLEYYPLNIEVYQERLGAFIMLVLGESMICLLVPYFDVNFASATYTFHIISFGIIFCYGIMYYDAANHGDGCHAVTQSISTAFLYMWMHIFIGLAVFFTSASMGMMYLEEVATLEPEAADAPGEGASGEEGGEGRRQLVVRRMAHHHHVARNFIVNALSGGFRGGLRGRGGVGGGRLLTEGMKSLKPDPTPSDDLSMPKLNADGTMTYKNNMFRPMCEPVQLLAAAVGGAIIFMTLMRSLHKGLEVFWRWRNRKLDPDRIGLIWRLVSGAFHFTVPYYGLRHPVINAAIHFALLFAMLLLEIRVGKHKHEEEGHEHSHGEGGEGEGKHAPVSSAEHTAKSSGARRFRFPAVSALAFVHQNDSRAVEMLRKTPTTSSSSSSSSSSAGSSSVESPMQH